jgi:hypothetical protein
MAELIVLLRQPSALRNGDVTLARQLAHQRPQGIEIVWKSVDRHDKDTSRFDFGCDPQPAS